MWMRTDHMVAWGRVGICQKARWPPSRSRVRRLEPAIRSGCLAVTVKAANRSGLLKQFLTATVITARSPRGACQRSIWTRRWSQGGHATDRVSSAFVSAVATNAAIDATRFFRLPPDRVVEIGSQVEI